MEYELKEKKNLSLFWGFCGMRSIPFYHKWKEGFIVEKKVTTRLIVIGVIAVIAVVSIVTAVVLLSKSPEIVLDAYVVESKGTCLVVQPMAGSDLGNANYYIIMKKGKENNIFDQKGNKISLGSLPVNNAVKITYSGVVRDTNPPQIEASKVVCVYQ